jgi:hypothetical protein
MNKIFATFVLLVVPVTSAGLSGSRDRDGTLTMNAERARQGDRQPHDELRACDPQFCEWPGVFDPETCGCRF